MRFCYGILLVGLGILAGCGDPNVPLTSPPNNEFRVSTPRPPRIDRTPTPSPTPTPTPTPDPNQVSLATLTARFLGIPWQDPEPPPSLMEITARYWGIPIPTPRPQEMPPAADGLPPQLTDGLLSPEQLQGLDLAILEELGLDLDTLDAADLESLDLENLDLENLDLEALDLESWGISEETVRTLLNNLSPEDIQNLLNLGSQFGIDGGALVSPTPSPTAQP